MVEHLIPTYIAHRLARGDRAANLESAARWVAWLTERYLIEPVCPWIVLASQWPESLRKLGLEVDLAAVRRCRAFVGVGPEWSTGMRAESDAFTGVGTRGWKRRAHRVASLVGHEIPMTRSGIVDGLLFVAGIRRRL